MGKNKSKDRVPNANCHDPPVVPNLNFAIPLETPTLIITSLFLEMILANLWKDLPTSDLDSSMSQDHLLPTLLYCNSEPCQYGVLGSARVEQNATKGFVF